MSHLRHITLNVILREVVPLVENFGSQLIQLVGIAPGLLTLRFSSSQMFSIMFKSGDLGGKLKTFTLFAFRYAVVALARWAGAPSCSNCIPDPHSLFTLVRQKTVNFDFTIYLNFDFLF